jgi:hypothetical protein
MTTQTAAIQTLTAQVKTLVIGKRQVTLSIARQLDVISSNVFRPNFVGWCKSLLGPDLQHGDLYIMEDFLTGNRAAFDQRYPMLQSFAVPEPEEVAQILGDAFVPFGRVNLGRTNINYIGRNSDGDLVLLSTARGLSSLVNKAYGEMPLIVLAGLR